jgi:cytochrome b561
MPLRNGEHGYGAVTKVLHWLTVVVVAAQLVVGYTMDTEDHAGRERFDRAEDACEAREDTDAAEAEEERCEEAVERDEDAFRNADDGRPSDLHVVLGVTLLALGVVRVLWRATTPLPPWSERYGPAGRLLQHWLEKVMLALLFVVPVTGLLLLDDAGSVALHVGSQIALLVAIGAHVLLQLAHRNVGRMV